MVRTLIFDENYKPKEVRRTLNFNNSRLFWTHITKTEDVEALLINSLKRKKSFIEDLLELQRPNIVQIDNLNIIVLSFPSKKSKVLQVTFILGKNKLITISNRESRTINELLDNLILKKEKVTGVTDIFSSIIDTVIEKSFIRLEELEDDLSKKEINILRKKESKSFLSKTNDLKEDLFFMSKLIRGDLEVIREIQTGRIKEINLKYLGEHFEDRILYLHDYIDLLKESVNNVNNLYVSMLSHRLNQHMYRLTIIGALMIIPSIISGFFGMNVTLPPLNFYQIGGITIIICIILWFFMREK